MVEVSIVYRSVAKFARTQESKTANARTLNARQTNTSRFNTHQGKVHRQSEDLPSARSSARSATTREASGLQADRPPGRSKTSKKCTKSYFFLLVRLVHAATRRLAGGLNGPGRTQHLLWHHVTDNAVSLSIHSITYPHPCRTYTTVFIIRTCLYSKRLVRY